jgi:hypothetical protein
MPKWVRKTFSSLLLEMRVFTQLVMTMESEKSTLPHPKISLSKVQCSHIITFTKLLGHLLMGERTTKLTIF